MNTTILKRVRKRFVITNKPKSVKVLDRSNCLVYQFANISDMVVFVAHEMCGLQAGERHEKKVSLRGRRNRYRKVLD